MDHVVRELEQKEFPELLTEIPDAPERLYIKGELPDINTKLLCIVGSRKYTPYGKGVCEKIINGLKGYDIAIVSGLAVGMDSIAHRASIENGIKTIAVPGSGLSEKVLYPRTNQGLARHILKVGGALLSEFEPDFRATPYSFPQRNRIMAGLSHATLVIEAGERSGTLITARLAMEYNRDVFTVPGSIFSQSTYGPHMLIKNGATPVTSASDVLDALGIKAENVTNTVNLQNLSNNERKVLQLLSSPLTREELINELDLSVTEANVLLSAMELKGLINEELGEVHASVN